MPKIYPLMFFCLCSLPVLAQLNPIELGRITLRELQQSVYPDDTAAHAVILKETGESRLDNEQELELIFHYYGKIKIQDASGLDAANIVIPLYRGERGDEEVYKIQAVAYNLEGGNIVKTELSHKDIYEEDISEQVTLTKFTFPNARPGSVLEYTYELHSPYLFNFRDWEFQHDIPTVRSEYWARIPGNFIYNMRLVGPFKLSLNESSISKECFRVGAGVADCALFKWAMDSIPAFIEEDYMTAASDFMPAVRFELSEVRYFDGQVNKYTKTWEDVEREMKQEKNFGLALKKAAGDFSDLAARLTAGSTGQLEKAEKIYGHFRDHFEWNGEHKLFAGDDLDKLYEAGTGSAADINLSLVAALQAAGLEAHPALLSTRENGYPVDIHPVISDFNYVVAWLQAGEKTILLDATDDFLPFGMLPFRCLSNKARVMDFEHSFWMEIPASVQFREITQLKLNLDSAAGLTGAYKAYKYGYDALAHRRRLAETSAEEYVRKLEDDLEGVKITNYRSVNQDSLEKPVIEEFDVDVRSVTGAGGGNIYLSAFLMNRIDENPFKLKERYYPVNFGAGWEIQNLVNIRLPENYRAASLPAPIGISLPADGGSFIMNVTGTQGQVNIMSKIVLKKPVYSSREYYYVKELFNRIIQAQAATIVLEPVN